MEETTPTFEQTKETVEVSDVVLSTEDENTNVIQESEFNEPESTVGTEEDVVSSTTESADQEDGPKATSEDDKSSEKPISPPVSDKLTSRIAVWMEEHGVDQRVIDLVYWKDVKKTAVVFGTELLILLFLVYHSVLSVVSFFALSVLTVSLLYRIAMTVIGAVQKTGTGSPYKSLLETNMEIPKEKARDIGESVGEHINKLVSRLTKLFLVEDIFASLKFAMFLWFLSCVGKWFNAITLLIAGTLLLFSVPKLYEDNQVQVDKMLCKVCQKTDEIVQQVKSKIESRFQKKEKSA